MFKKAFVLIFLCALSLLVTGCTEDVESAESKEKETIDSSDSTWEVSPLFKSEGYTMIGEEGRIGFIYDDTEVVRFYPGKVNKYMWHFWGEDEEFNGPLKIKATHEKKEEGIVLLEDLPVGGANNGANKHAPSNFSLPESGIWRLDAFFGNDFFGSIFIEVYEK